MDEELKELKTVLRSLVVSSPTKVDLRSLLRDYRNMVGKQIPLAKYGYRDHVTFLKDHFSDCFLFQGPTSNPELVLIVPDTLKHIDNFVQKQKSPATAKIKGKRRSVPEPLKKPIKSDLIIESFNRKINIVSKEYKELPRSNNDSTLPKPVEEYQQVTVNSKQSNENNTQIPVDNPDNGACSQSALQRFLKKRTALCSSQWSISDKSSNEMESLREEDDSGRQTSSSLSSSKRTQLEILKREMKDIIISHCDGVLCTDLLRLYRERYGRELNFSRFGYTSVLSAACALSGVHVARQPAGDWLLSDERAPPPAAPPAPRAAPRAPPRAPPAAPDSDDALPGVAFDADVFPEDCMHFLESIPAMSLAGIEAGSMLEVIVGEVYSPSHFWLIRLGEQYNIAMEDIMDEMNHYYTHGEGKERALALGAVRAGHYCSSCYEGDWHRSLIVKVVDSDTVKVRHVDYGTVERCETRGLRALPRRWARLPAQAVRARLAGARPPAAGRRWPRPAAHHFLRLVRDARFVANVVAVDERDAALEVLLIDTAGRDDRCVTAELVRAGHADARPGPALATSECYLYPRFAALENGDTPNFAEINAYLRDGIVLEFVDDYRRHVPPCLPTPLEPTTTPPPKPCARLAPRCALPAREPPEPRPHTHLTAPAPAPPQGYSTGSALVTPGYGGAVSLPASDCEVFALLSTVDPAAAQRFMLDALRRAMLQVGASGASGASLADVRPPPGFENVARNVSD